MQVLSPLLEALGGAFSTLDAISPINEETEIINPISGGTKTLEKGTTILDCGASVLASYTIQLPDTTDFPQSRFSTFYIVIENGGINAITYTPDGIDVVAPNGFASVIVDTLISATYVPHTKTWYLK